jgi:hypothetical protein
VVGIVSCARCALGGARVRVGSATARVTRHAVSANIFRGANDGGGVDVSLLIEAGSGGRDTLGTATALGHPTTPVKAIVAGPHVLSAVGAIPGSSAPGGVAHIGCCSGLTRTHGVWFSRPE